jgi:hypothetical protein
MKEEFFWQEEVPYVYKEGMLRCTSEVLSHTLN